MKIEELSISQYGRYLKLFIALTTGYLIPYIFGHKELSASMAASAWLSLSLGPSVSNSKGYFLQRSMANFVPIFIGVLVFIITKHAFISMVIVTLFMFFLVSKFPNTFRLTSMGIALALITVFGGDFVAAQTRVLSVWAGMFLGFLIECYILPPDQGYKLKKMISSMEKIIVKIFYEILYDKNFDYLKKLEVDFLLKDLKDIEKQFSLFNKDYSIKWIKHLRKYKKDISFFGYSIELFEVSIKFLQKICLFKDELLGLTDEEREQLFKQVRLVLEKHEKLLVSFYEKTESIENEDEFLLERNVNVLKNYLTEYQNTIKKINIEIINMKNLK